MTIKIPILLVCIILFAHCKQKHPYAFTVSGNITNAGYAKVYLEHLPFGGQESVIVDSTSLKKDGFFTLNTFAKEEGLYALVVENGPEILLINDSKEIRIALNAQQYTNYTVQNSVASNALHDFIDMYRISYPSLIRIMKENDSIQATKTNDSIMAVRQKMTDAQLASINGYIMQQLNTYNSPALHYFLLGKAINTMSKEELSLLVNTSASKFKEYHGLALLQNIFAHNIPTYALINQIAPPIHLPDTNGILLNMDSLKGKYVLVDFWASWCHPCREENPTVVKAHEKYKDKNFTILGVSLDNNPNEWKDAIKKDHLTWKHVSDGKQWESPIVKAYHIEGIPFNVLLNPNGKIIAFGLKGADLDKKLAEVLK